MLDDGSFLINHLGMCGRKGVSPLSLMRIVTFWISSWLAKDERDTFLSLFFLGLSTCLDTKDLAIEREVDLYTSIIATSAASKLLRRLKLHFFFLLTLVLY